MTPMPVLSRPGYGIGQAAGGLLSPDEFEKLTEFVYRKTGMRFGEVKRQYVEKRIADRMAASGIASFREYFARLRFEASGGELQALINLLTVNETYFLRESYQLDCLVRDVLPEIAARKGPGERVRIWSLPCATGEEPYSIAISVLEHWPDADRFEVEIHASDIDSNVLARARAGLYGERSLQKMPLALRRKYFRPADKGQLAIVPELQGSIEFSRVNVADPVEMARFRHFDVIFCRNMLIYFDELSQRQAVALLYDSLAPRGYVFLGHSESMNRMSSSFRPRKFADAIVYQRA